MNAWEIEINFNNAMRKADEVDSIANELRTLANRKFDGSLQRLAQNWQSDNSSAFIQKGNMLEGQMVNTARNLDKIADSIRSCAQRIRDAERRALEIAQKRTYKN